ncbi:MAG: glycosyltransferase [Candidatus Omnitrophica bacterium]|nr:glycosyltransferase [Candidatus Omnitrophota bacterium]
MAENSIMVSIIIVNWNTKELLQKCLESIYKGASDTSFEVIVVDNASSDGSVEFFKKKFPRVIIIENKSNQGFAKANNLAIRRCKGKYLLFLNPDTVVFNDSIKLLVNFLEENPNFDIVGPKIINPDKSVQFECARNFPTLLSELFCITVLDRLFPKNTIFGKYLMSYWNHNESKEVDAVSGACFLIKRALMQEFLFDEQFFMYAEDTDLFFMIKKNKKKIFFLANADIIHVRGGSSNKNPFGMVLEEKKSMHAFFYKHYTRRAAFFYRLVILFGSIIMLPLWVLLWATGLKERRKISYIIKRYFYMFLWALGAK